MTRIFGGSLFICDTIPRNLPRMRPKSPCSKQRPRALPAKCRLRVVTGSDPSGGVRVMGFASWLGCGAGNSALVRAKHPPIRTQALHQCPPVPWRLTGISRRVIRNKSVHILSFVNTRSNSYKLTNEFLSIHKHLKVNSRIFFYQFIKLTK